MKIEDTIQEIMKDYPTQKIGLDDFYGRQTVINMLNKAINYNRCCTELNNCFKVGEIVIYQGVKMRVTFVDNCQKTANMYCMCDDTNWEAISLSKLKKII